MILFMNLLFPFEQTWAFYLGFTLFVLAVLALDLGVFHRKAHTVHFKEALGWSAFWLAVGLAFSLVIYQYALMQLGSHQPDLAKQSALEYLTGFVVEKTLAIDNLFIFVVVFSYFGIDSKYQHRVLFFGILGALIFRALFIALGSVLLQFQVLIVIFGAILIVTGIKMFFSPEKPVDPDKSWVIRLFKKVIPTTPHLEGQRFFIRKNGVLYGTPLLMALAFLEVTDIIFAIDSVPAIFALTKEPLIVFTSNVFAILGMRSLYFLLANVVGRFQFLKYGLASVLVFVGLKMAYLNQVFGGHFPITWSLLIISILIGGSIVASLLVPVKKQPLKLERSSV